MTGKKAANKTKPAAVVANDTDAQEGTLKDIGGSRFDHWNNILANQTLQALWLKHSGSETRDKQFSATVAALIGIGPKDELEGMMAAQLIAAHNAAMEAHRRAMLPDQSFEGRHEALNQANKLSRTFVTLVEGLDRHRGKGQQKVTVEHVYVAPGGQAVVAVVEPGGGDRTKLENQSHARQIVHASQPTMRCADEARQPVPTGSNGEFPLQDARWNKSGCSQG
jgi:hypothetical protein